jgi:hypothetical protein
LKYHHAVLKTTNAHKSHESFRTALFDSFPLLEQLLYTNLVLAGGAPCCIMRDMIDKINDYDLYMISSETDIKAHAQTYISTTTIIAKALIQQYHHVTIKRTIGFTEFKARYQRSGEADKHNSSDKTFKIQLMHRVYQSANDILTGFDIGSSMLLFDGQKLYTNKIGEFSYKYNYNVCTPSSDRLLSLSGRLCKYYLRGFDIIFPDIDYTKFEERTNIFAFIVFSMYFNLEPRELMHMK